MTKIGGIGSTYFVEESRHNYHGFTEIDWRCEVCKYIISLPQQQHFNYCLHCGRKVIYKEGGAE